MRWGTPGSSWSSTTTTSSTISCEPMQDTIWIHELSLYCEGTFPACFQGKCNLSCECAALMDMESHHSRRMDSAVEYEIASFHVNMMSRILQFTKFLSFHVIMHCARFSQMMCNSTHNVQSAILHVVSILTYTCKLSSIQ